MGLLFFCCSYFYFWSCCTDSLPFITAAACRGAVIQAAESWWLDWNHDPHPQSTLSLEFPLSILSQHFFFVSSDKPTSCNSFNKWLLNARWFWQTPDSNMCQLYANGTKTTLFWGNVLGVTVCAKGNGANGKKHGKPTMKTQRVPAEDGKCNLKITKQNNEQNTLTRIKKATTDDWIMISEKDEPQYLIWTFSQKSKMWCRCKCTQTWSHRRRNYVLAQNKIIVSWLKNTQWTHFKNPPRVNGTETSFEILDCLMAFPCSQMLSAPALSTHAAMRALLRRHDSKTRLQNSLKKIYVCGSDFPSFWPLQRQTSERTINAPTGFPLSRLLLMSISNITPVISSICSSLRECYFVRPCMKEMCFFLSFFPFQISLWVYFLFLCTFKFSLNRSGTKRQAQRFLVN